MLFFNFFLKFKKHILLHMRHQSPLHSKFCCMSGYQSWTHLISGQYTKAGPTWFQRPSNGDKSWASMNTCNSIEVSQAVLFDSNKASNPFLLIFVLWCVLAYMSQGLSPMSISISCCHSHTAGLGPSCLGRNLGLTPGTWTFPSHNLSCEGNALEAQHCLGLLSNKRKQLSV